jgi:murein DD-endopeptidase MepM/ murein hydrolase activator NlpD
MGSSPNALYQYARFVLDRINTVFTRIRQNRSAILSLATSCLIIASAHGYAAGVNSNVPVSSDSHGAPLSVSLQSIIPSDTSSLTEQSAWHEKSRDLTPQPRPDFIEAWGGEIVDIALPTNRPALSAILPGSAASLTEMVRRETNQELLSEVTVTMAKGDTLAKLLARGGAPAQARSAISKALAVQMDLRRLQIGTKFTLGFDSDETVTALQVHVPRLKRSGLSRREGAYLDLFALKSEELGGWISLKALRPLSSQLVQSGNFIDYSLYRSASQVKIPPPTLDEFVRVMGFSVDFQRQIRQNDQFELIYEKTVDALTGNELSSGELIYAGIILSGNKIEFFRHVSATGKTSWYDRNGNSAVRTLMRTPVNGARLSSGFGVRRHPVTGFSAMHRGIDFAVPKGTPILAAGSGVIESSGWNGNYGKYIRIRHDSTYKTAYAHMSRIASRAVVGRYVEQGDVIGFVGSTGRSTGPHLHYEIMVNNRQLNPLTVQLPTAEELPDAEREDFLASIALLESQISDTPFRSHSQKAVEQAALDK